MEWLNYVDLKLLFSGLALVMSLVSYRISVNTDKKNSDLERRRLINPEHLVLKKMVLEQSIVEISSLCKFTDVKVPGGATLLYTTAPKDGYEKLEERNRCISDTLALMIRFSQLELVHPIVELKPEITFEGKDALRGLESIAHLGIVRNIMSDENIVHSSGISFGQKNVERSHVNFQQISFRLTKSGFDLGLRYIEHEDQENRFTISTRISKLALVVAVVIAIGSIGNLIIKLLCHP